ncbi:MAG: hypothetical protein Q8S20_16360 [Sulfuritalea sp.]|nr:hypothetical protein [Sulfuritalea sp.]
MDSKQFKVRFYVGQVGAAGGDGLVSEALDAMDLAGCPVIKIGNLSYEIRGLKRFKDGASFRGVFARFRSDDLPHVGKPGGKERELDIEPDDGLLEKNYFLYYRKHQLLVYQENGNGSVVGRLGEYFSNHFNAATVFQPVLQPDATMRLLRADVQPMSLELSFARPTNAEWFPKDDFSRELLALMKSAKAPSIHLSLSGTGRGALRQPLSQKVKRSVVGLLGHGDVKVARLLVEDEEGRHPIDLISDRLMHRIEVEMAGRYPVEQSVFNGLMEAKDEHNDALETIFGAGDGVLD